MKILFAIPRIFGSYPGANIPHLGVACLAAFLLQHKHDIEIIDMRLDYTEDELKAKIDDFAPDAIGVTSVSYEYGKAYSLMESIKKYAKCPLIVGGPHVSALRKRVLEETRADFAVKMEGEYTLLELCEALQKKGDLSKIRGLIWRRGGKIIENEDREHIKNLDALPFPAYEKFPLEKYLCFVAKKLPIATSRGCPYQCIFCSVRLSMGCNFRPRSPENVVAEIEKWYGRGWTEFEFVDDCFNFDMDRAKKICDLILQKNIVIKWYLNNGIRTNHVDRELLEKMKATGCVFVSFGVESANRDVLIQIKKGITPEIAKNAIELAHDVGIPTVSASFIIGHPTETFKKFMDSLNFAKTEPLDMVNFYNLVPYPGTELCEWVKKNGRFRFTEKEYLNSVSYWDKFPIFETDEFTAEERKKAYKLGHDLWRKKVLTAKMGKVPGYIAWFITKPEFIENTAHKVFAGTKIGKKIFSLVRQK